MLMMHPMLSSGCLRFTVFIAGLLLGNSALALTIHYDPLRDAQLQSCDRQLESGLRTEARACFEELLTVADELVRAEAARALGQVRVANRLFRELASSSDDPYVKVRWGELFLETHQVADAAALFRESLQQQSDFIPAMLGLAAAQGRRFEGQARQTLYDVLEAQPDSLRALLLLARLDLETQQLAEAERLLGAAQQVATRSNAPQLEIHALYAALDLLRGNPDSDSIDEALAINPHYGDIYAIPAHFYIITYRYREAVDLYRRAVKIEPDLHSARSKLGINLLRINDVFGARYHLEKAYAGDPFNTETVNTLRLLDDMDDMRVGFTDVPSRDNPDDTIGRVIVKLNREDADALEPYVLALSTDAVQTFTERYQFNLNKPVTVELFHNHDDFGVRTVSTPGVGLLGVTFGYVLAMDSPRARRPGDFHWASTLWHELAHVFTLEAANHLLPRWFSEGLSVYEEWHTGPLPSRELPLQVLQMLKADRFLPLANLDSGFVRPTYEGQVSVSYMQAGLLCDYISQHWGHHALVQMLHAFGRGDDVNTVVNRYLKVTLTEFDQMFLNHVRETYATTLDRLDELQQLPRVLANAMRNSDWLAAERFAEELIEIYPEFVGAGNGYLALARAQAEQGRALDATRTRMMWFRRGGYEPDVLRQLADELAAIGFTVGAAQVLEALNWVSPYYASEHEKLGRFYLELDQPQKALQSFDALIGLSEEHAATAWLGKSRAQQQLGEIDKARRSILIALEQAPFYRDAQHLLLELNAGDNLD